MPIYEYLCRHCNRIYSFHSFKVVAGEGARSPVCPRCSADELSRVPSRFGVGATTTKASGGDGLGDNDDPRVEREMMQLMSQLEGIDESNPREIATAMRRMVEIAGEPMTPAMEEMMRRLEAGEDPEKVEEEMGDQLEQEMAEHTGPGMPAAPTRDSGLYPM